MYVSHNQFIGGKKKTLVGIHTRACVPHRSDFDVTPHTFTCSSNFRSECFSPGYGVCDGFLNYKLLFVFILLFIAITNNKRNAAGGVWGNDSPAARCSRRHCGGE